MKKLTIENKNLEIKTNQNKQKKLGRNMQRRTVHLSTEKYHFFFLNSI